ncbi:MAG: HAD domain-containing protein, partial [Anaerobutyricum hallii]
MKVVFLDIDGVLYPCFSRRTKCFDAETVRLRLHRDGISTKGISDWDVCSVACGFQKEAVERLRRLCEQCDARIVLETSWKCMRSLEEMKRLFSLWRLDSYI